MQVIPKKLKYVSDTLKDWAYFDSTALHACMLTVDWYDVINSGWNKDHEIFFYGAH
jgi:hypothetical protein